MSLDEFPPEISAMHEWNSRKLLLRVTLAVESSFICRKVRQDVNITAELNQGSSRSSPIEKKALEHHPVPALILDKQGSIASQNKAARELFSLYGRKPTSPESLIGEITSTDTDRLMQDVVAGASAGFVTVQINSDNAVLDKRLRFAVTPLKSQPRVVVHFLLTLEPFAPLSKSFLQLNAALRDANIAAAKERKLLKELEQSYVRLSEFSSIAAHDLKAPLRNISMLLDFIDEDHGDDLAEDGITMLRSARDAARRMQKLIVDLLEHAKTNSKIITLEKINVTNAIYRVHENLSTTIKMCGGRIDYTSDIKVIDADPLLFHQLLENLIGNAIKYRSPERPPLVIISCRSVSDTEVEFQIKDNGLGFENKYKQKILLPFKRLYAQSEIEGTGIGLANCKSICDRHGWAFSCEGKLNVGATFTIKMNTESSITPETEADRLGASTISQ